jgi:glucose/arabinose dehydrogenase
MAIRHREFAGPRPKPARLLRYVAGMRKLAIALIATACAREANTLPAAVSAPNDPQLQHHEIHFEQLPPPFATPSAGNPPRMRSQRAGDALHLPPGFKISLFASGLDDPRAMILAPNGDVILSEPGANKITLLRDANHDGVAELKYTLIDNLNDPYGLALQGRWLYIGSEDAVLRVPYTAGETRITAPPQRITPLPPGGHSTRGLLFSPDGSKLYVSVGSRSNVNAGEPPERAAISVMNPDGTARRIFAGGLRNPVGMAWNPATGALWTAVNERDGMGDDLVPDFVTDVRDGAFYGWPYAYLGPHEEPRRKGERPDLVAKTIAPSVLVQAHSAALGVAFYEGSMFPAEYRGSAFVAFHGSWNRSKRTGYKIVRIPFRNGKPAGGYDDFVVGWMTDENARDVWGRPVGLLVLRDGSLLISDDGGEKIWRVTYGR